MRALSLRTRLVAVAVALVAFAVIAAGAGTYTFLRSYLVTQIDDNLAGILAMADSQAGSRTATGTSRPRSRR